jgi:hypothetical protein
MEKTILVNKGMAKLGNEQKVDAKALACRCTWHEP